MANRWRLLAESNQLDFHLDKSVYQYPRVTGNYEGYQLTLEIIKDEKMKEWDMPPSIDTHIVLTRRQKAVSTPSMTIEQTVERFFSLNTSDYSLTGKVYGAPDGYQVSYKQSGLETDVSCLEYIFEVLANMADTYSQMFALGGRAVPFLEEKAKLSVLKGNNSLRPITIQLLREIRRDTTARLAHQASDLLCSHCFVRCKAHQVTLSLVDSITYFGCSDCHQSQDFIEWSDGPVVAVLDQKMETKLSKEARALRVNWLLHRVPFNFEMIEIVKATDEEVERFAMQINNDTNEARQRRYKEMICTVSTGCKLSENSMRILRRTFGQVE